MGFFTKHSNAPQIQDLKIQFQIEAICVVCGVKLKHGETKMTEDEIIDLRIPISFDGKHNRFKNVESYHLKTFKISQDRVPLLSAMHLDSKMFYKDSSGFQSRSELYEWLLETHPHSARSISESEFSRWDDLFDNLRYSRD